MEIALATLFSHGVTNLPVVCGLAGIETEHKGITVHSTANRQVKEKMVGLRQSWVLLRVRPNLAEAL